MSIERHEKYQRTAMKLKEWIREADADRAFELEKLSLLDDQNETIGTLLKRIEELKQEIEALVRAHEALKSLVYLP